MKQYDSYRDSGVEWIGRIPSHWGRCRFKNLATMITVPSTSTKKIGLENIEGMTGRFIPTDSEFEGNGIAFIKNDIVYGKLRPYLQKVWLAEFEGNAVGDFFIYRCNKNCVPKYLHYFMLSDGFTSVCNGATFGAKMPRVPSNFIESLRFYLPNFEEQKAIASYLDAQTARIDSIIEAREKKIKLLEELRAAIISKAVTKGIRKNVETKDSGIEWIGKIPKHWEVRRLKHMGNAENGLTYSPNDVCEEPGILVLRSSNIQNDRIDLIDKVYVKSVPDNLKVKKGDIIICSRNGSVSLVGKSALVEDDINATFGAFMIRFNTQFHFKYIYFLVSDVIKHYKGLFSTTTINQLTLGMFSQMYAPLAPSLEEQKEIAEYIIRRTSQIEKGMLKARCEIELLKEYRASLITEVVTGKRKVI